VIVAADAFMEKALGEKKGEEDEKEECHIQRF
jgi:hypothetical protein